MKNNPRQPKRWLIILILIVLIVSLFHYVPRLIRQFLVTGGEEEFIFLNTESSATTKASSKHKNDNFSEELLSSELIPVYITGEVKIPGVYRVKEGQILDDLVTLAGGLTAKAAPTAVNLACELKANQLYRIPSQDELAANPDLYFKDSATAEEFANNKININTANQIELETLPGVGPATAQAIIKYRDQHGPFQTTEDIMLIPGIKEARFRSLEDLITVDQ